MNDSIEPPQRRLCSKLQFSVRTFVIAVTAASVLIAVKRDWLRSLFEDSGRSIPADFDFSSKHALWNTPVGSRSLGSPIVAGDRLFVGTNNRRGLLERCPPTQDMGVLLCLDRTTGDLLWQAATQQHSNRQFSYPYLGQRGEPVVQEDRIWYINNRHELVCLDTEGFYDGEDDGLPCEIDSKWDRTKEADVVWQFDLIAELGITPKEYCYVDCGNSPICSGDVLLCVTGHCHLGASLDEPSVEAPCFIAVNKNTGKLIWSNSSSSMGSRDVQTGTPVCANLGGVTQAIFPGGDGWLYSFDLKSLKNGKTNLLWKFDCNPKNASWELDAKVQRMALLCQPLINDGKVYVATANRSGVMREMTPAQIWCIDPTRRGDVSADIVVNQADLMTPIGDKLPSACDVAAGDVIKPNPNSAAIWRYDGVDKSNSAAIGFASCRNKLSIRDGMLVAVDDSGYVHSLNAKTGELYWTYDILDSGSGSAVFTDDHILVPHPEGLTPIVFSKDANVATGNVNGANTILSPSEINATPAIADNKLYVLTNGSVYAIGDKDHKK